jgi:hypothetical protein
MLYSDILAVERQLAIYHIQLSSQSLNPGRMRCGDIAMGNRILRNPSLYPAGLERDIVGIRPLKRREAVREFLRRGQTGFARTTLAEAFAEHASFGNALQLALVTLIDNGLGRGALDAMSFVWKRLLKRRFAKRLSTSLKTDSA